jgi:hypothetical protein
MKEKYLMRLFENRELRRILGLKMEEVIGKWLDIVE